MTDELREKNIELAALNLRLRKHGENVDELTRSKERLETKARIHSELGQALLSTRRYLMDEDGDQPVPLELWQRNIAMLRKEAELKEDEQPLEMLSRIAASTGIAIQFDGDLPSNTEHEEPHGVPQPHGTGGQGKRKRFGHLRSEAGRIKTTEYEEKCRPFWAALFCARLENHTFVG